LSDNNKYKTTSYQVLTHKNVVALKKDGTSAQAREQYHDDKVKIVWFVNLLN